jgi:hypothetical protein
MRRGKGKFTRELKNYFKDYTFNKHHFYYTVLILIILLLSLFLFNNYNKCTVYEVNTNTDSFNVNNGLLVLTKDDSILKVSDITYEGDIINAMYIEMGLYVVIDDEYYLINSFSSTSDEGFNLNDYLAKIKFDITENSDNIDIFTNDIKANIVDNLYLKVNMTSIDGEVIEDEFKLDVNPLYQNVKLFY